MCIPSLRFLGSFLLIGLIENCKGLMLLDVLWIAHDRDPREVSSIPMDTLDPAPLRSRDAQLNCGFLLHNLTCEVHSFWVGGSCNCPEKDPSWTGTSRTFAAAIWVFPPAIQGQTLVIRMGSNAMLGEGQHCIGT